MKFRRVLLVIVLSVSLQGFENPAHGDDWVAAETKNWVDCSSGYRSIDCIDSVEFSLPASEKRDPVTGALDYNSVQWVKAKFSKNNNYKYKENYDGLVRSDDPCNSYGNGDYFADGCYTAAGLKSGGGDVLFHMMVYTGRESMKAMQWVDVGENNPAVREDGWKAITVPVGSTWRVTLKSNNLARELGWMQSNIKNPLINISQGTDGISRVAVSGTVYPSFGGCNVTGEKKPATTPDEQWCAKADTYAETMSQGFSIDYMPYKYTTEPMKGSAAGGIIVSTNGQQSELRYDRDQGILWVPTFGPHFEFDKKTINKGWMEASIKGDVVRKAFKLDPATAGNFAKVEIVTQDGVADVATYNLHYDKVIDTLQIRAYNFHYSAPTVKIVLGKPAQTSTASTNPAKTENRNSTITCIKGKTSKKVTGINPKCPAGYKKK
jgi:hypothetical protein